MSDNRADNTSRNRTDRDTTTKTPIDQDNSSTSTRIAAEIRRAIIADKAMSMNAQNCKVIVDAAGVVTLRGPVATKAEKDSIGAIAKTVVGVTRVVNELEVK
jgi:osmotically-inducible protein OsmY